MPAPARVDARRNWRRERAFRSFIFIRDLWAHDSGIAGCVAMMIVTCEERKNRGLRKAGICSTFPGVPVQDLTPQLRTRLSRVERVVGVFVSVATLLLLAGFAYYVYHTGVRKGWWTFKARYYTEVDSGAGLAVGGDVRLLGFRVGRITEVEANPPFSPKAVHVAFYVLHPYEGYIWTDSRANVAAGDFLGGRIIEITPGGSSIVPGSTDKVE